jgi:hypothetical protein
MKIEICRNGEYYMSHTLPEMARNFSQSSSEARAMLVKQTVILLRSRIRSVTGSDMGFTFWLVASSILSNATEMNAWRERKSREAVQEGTCTL